MDNTETNYPTPPASDGPDYYGQTQPHAPKFGTHRPASKKKLWIILAVLAVVVLGGGGTAAYLLMHKAKPQPAAQKSATTQQHTGNVQDNGTSYTFKSSTINVGVTYPKTWTQRESTDKQEIILTSPHASYVKKDGSTAQGVFTIKLRNGIIPDAIKATVQNAVAVADSQVIAYSKPTSDQRQYTNLSYAGSDANNFSFGIVTGYTSYKAGQQFGGGVALDGQAYLFAGGFGTDSGDSLAFDQVPKADYDTAIFEQAVGIFESLQLY